MSGIRGERPERTPREGRQHPLDAAMLGGSVSGGGPRVAAIEELCRNCWFPLYVTSHTKWNLT